MLNVVCVRDFKIKNVSDVFSENVSLNCGGMKTYSFR